MGRTNHAARLVHQLGLAAGGDERVDLVIEHAPVARRILVPDHQSVCRPRSRQYACALSRFAHQMQVVGIAHARSTIGRSPEIA